MAEPAEKVGAKPVDPKEFADAVKARDSARLRMWLDICAHCGLCADVCHTQIARDGDPTMLPAYKAKKVLDVWKKGDNLTEEDVQKLWDTAYGECTACRRCSVFCPFGIDIATIIAAARGTLFDVGRAPEALVAATRNYLETGNQMAVTEEEWIETLEWMLEELQEELPGATCPIDKKGANLLYTVNAREPKFYPMDIAHILKIFHVVGEDFTFSTKGWDDTNLAMFAGDIKSATYIARLVRDAAEELEVKRVAITE